MTRAPRGICEVCGDAIDALATAAFPVKGWEVERGGGGANAIVGRERLPDRIAHADCVKRAADKARRGISSSQGSLL